MAKAEFFGEKMGKIKSIYTGGRKGKLKKRVSQVSLKKNYGIIGDSGGFSAGLVPE